MLPTIDPSTLAATTTLDRKILTDQPDLENWKLTPTFQWIQEYLEELVEGSKQPATTEGETNQVIQQLVQFLTQVSEICHEHRSPSSTSSTNHKQEGEFVSFRSKLTSLITSFHSSLIPTLPTASLAELNFHLTRSFGSVSRLDYGTSHELSFILYLLILRLTSSLTPLDSKHTVTEVLNKYWQVSELVRKTFGLEEAGKRGVWKKEVDGEGRMWFDQGASQARGHPSRSTSSHSLSSSHSSPLYLLRSLLLTPNSNSSSLLQLYETQVLLSLPALLHLRFGLYLPFSLSSSADQLSKEQVEELEGLQDERVGNEGTVAPWNVPVLSGEEDLMRLRGGGASGWKCSEAIKPIEVIGLERGEEERERRRIEVRRLAGLDKGGERGVGAW